VPLRKLLLPTLWTWLRGMFLLGQTGLLPGP
jgi:hypothetical protein